jgi:hypothetical protein
MFLVTPAGGIRGFVLAGSVSPSILPPIPTFGQYDGWPGCLISLSLVHALTTTYILVLTYPSACILHSL